MGEKARKIGEKLEGFGTNLFKGFGWNELTRDREIICYKSTHKKKTHGIDIMMDYQNPYLNCKQGIVVECKNRQMVSITQSEIDAWVSELVGVIECAQNSPELSDIDLSNTSVFTGLLLIHANDEFKEKLFNKYLANLKIPTRRNPINIFIAGNKEIDKWNSLLSHIENIYSEGFKYIYPSIDGSNMVQSEFISINSLYSKYVFGQQLTYVDANKNGNPYKEPIMKKILFVFDDITVDSFKYLWSMFKHYQLQDADHLDFVFYPSKVGDVELVKTKFISTLYQIDNPIDKDIANKIHISFMENRNMSPVDNGRR